MCAFLSQHLFTPSRALGRYLNEFVVTDILDSLITYRSYAVSTIVRSDGRPQTADRWLLKSLSAVCRPLSAVGAHYSHRPRNSCYLVEVPRSNATGDPRFAHPDPAGP